MEYRLCVGRGRSLEWGNRKGGTQAALPFLER
jgi:hypothetical protein